MECPTCRKEFHEMWQPLTVVSSEVGQPLPKPRTDIRTHFKGVTELQVTLRWAECPNEACGQIIVTGSYYRVNFTNRLGSNPYHDSRTLILFPTGARARAVDRAVPPAMQRDYTEAAAILDASPRMSSVLSRRILADLLETYAGFNDYSLADRIEKFGKDAKHPSTLRENLDYLREMGNFAAHTKKDSESEEVIDVSREEAEWTLDVVDGLFDYFIIGPAKDRERKDAFAEKMEKAGRRPVKKPDGGKTRR